METKYRKQRWGEQITFSGETWDGYDLTETDFANVVFQNTTFKKCVFSKSKFTHVRLFDCSFFDCQFDRVDLSAPPFGAASGLYHKCCFK